ncbi:formate dehydrogenase accessory protein FdhE domain-containing protein [Pseudomonas sp. HLS-6 TE3448]
MSSIQLTPVEPRSPGITEIPAVLLPSLKQRYAPRAARLRQLAEEHVMADYLNFAANIVAAQQHLLDTRPLPAACVDGLAERLGRAQPPLAYSRVPACALLARRAGAVAQSTDCRGNAHRKCRPGRAALANTCTT